MNRAEELSVDFVRHQPGGAAKVLEQLPAAQAAAFLTEAPRAEAAAVLSMMQPARAADVLAQCAPETAGALLVETESYARSLLLRTLPGDVRDRVVEAAPRRQAAILHRHLSYSANSVGAWMDTPKATFPPDLEVQDCLGQVRRLGTRPGSAVFVTDSSQRLIGTVGLEVLLAADGTALLDALLDREPATLSPHATIQGVASHPAWDTSLSMPVVDRRQRLIGVLHFDSVREGLLHDRKPAQGASANIVLLHLVQGLLVSVSGLLNAALTKPDITRASNQGDG
jgi:Mg/Co/Ni transporter MgtE